jgi:hypothetical protein
MILVERLSQPGLLGHYHLNNIDDYLKSNVLYLETTTGGLFLPKIEGKDLKQLAYVLSVPQGYGLESEQGRVQPLKVSYCH